VGSDGSGKKGKRRDNNRAVLRVKMEEGVKMMDRGGWGRTVGGRRTTNDASTFCLTFISFRSRDRDSYTWHLKFLTEVNFGIKLKLAKRIIQPKLTCKASNAKHLIHHSSHGSQHYYQTIKKSGTSLRYPRLFQQRYQTYK
jgi:hypothetical protein